MDRFWDIISRMHVGSVVKCLNLYSERSGCQNHKCVTSLKQAKSLQSTSLYQGIGNFYSNMTETQLTGMLTQTNIHSSLISDIAIFYHDKAYIYTKKSHLLWSVDKNVITPGTWVIYRSSNI